MNNFILDNEYIIQKNNIARWMDQKCTPDVLNIVSDCIMNFIEEHDTNQFKTSDIWKSEYTCITIKSIFNKPDLTEKGIKNEYDKFFLMPFDLLSSANVLSKVKPRNNLSIFTVINKDILEYIATNDRNAYNFIRAYCEKVLRDNNQWFYFEEFLSKSDNESYQILRNKFFEFIKETTRITKDYEPPRILAKVLNPLACYYGTKGSKKGKVTKNIKTFSELLYNNMNFRDLHSNKPKNVTRKEWASKSMENNDIKRFYSKQNIKAKKFLREFNNENNNGKSECIFTENKDFEATQLHHIFPVNEFPEIQYYYENIIALTPTQHLAYAHPNNNTSLIDKSYQKYLLLSKLSSIKENIFNECVDTIYDSHNFLYILNIGFDENYEVEDNDFETFEKIICSNY